MKKVFVFLSIFFCMLFNVNAEDKIIVTFNDCIDGDTASVILNDEIIKLRFLAVDTPESVHPTIGEEEYGKEASNYTCKALKNAKKIEIEYDSNSDKKDKYERHLAWIFVDGELLQAKLVEQGLAEVAYLYGDYKYTPLLESKQLIAQTKQIGIWNNSIEYEKIIIGIIIIIVCIILFITNIKFRNKITTKVKKKAKKELKKIFDENKN